MADIDGAKMFVKGWKIFFILIIFLVLLTTYGGKIEAYYYNMHFKNDSFTCISTDDYVNTGSSNNVFFIKCKGDHKLIEFPIYNEDLYYKATGGKQVIKVKGSTDILLVESNHDTLIFNCAR